MNTMATQYEINMTLIGMKTIGLCLFFVVGLRMFFDKPTSCSKTYPLNGIMIMLGLAFYFSAGLISSDISSVFSIRETFYRDDVSVSKTQDYIRLDVPAVLSMSGISVTAGGKKLPFIYKNVDKTHKLIIDDKAVEREKILVEWDTEFGRNTIELAYPPRWLLLLVAVLPVILTIFVKEVYFYFLKNM